MKTCSMAVAIFEQQAGKRQALASGPQARLAEPLDHVWKGPRRRHVTDIRRAATKIKHRVRLAAHAEGYAPTREETEAAIREVIARVPVPL